MSLYVKGHARIQNTIIIDVELKLTFINIASPAGTLTNISPVTCSTPS